jgi:hypothetical protein
MCLRVALLARVSIAQRSSAVTAPMLLYCAVACTVVYSSIRFSKGSSIFKWTDFRGLMEPKWFCDFITQVVPVLIATKRRYKTKYLQKPGMATRLLLFFALLFHPSRYASDTLSCLSLLIIFRVHVTRFMWRSRKIALFAKISKDARFPTLQ